MKGLIKSELRKLSTTWMWFGLTLGGALACGLITMIVALTSGRRNGDNVVPPLSNIDQVRTVYGTTYGIGTLFTLILGIIVICGEFRHQTITPTVLASPRRNRVVYAKLAGTTTVSFLSGLAMGIVGISVGMIVISAKGYSVRLGNGDIQKTLALSLLGLVVWGILGLGVGTLLKNQVAAILVVLGWTFVAENLIVAGLNALKWYWFTKFLPGQASTAMVRPRNQHHLLPWWGGTLTLLGYGVIAAAVGMFFTLRRDIS
jgi:ABC-2 type transport system permease protein